MRKTQSSHRAGIAYVFIHSIRTAEMKIHIGTIFVALLLVGMPLEAHPAPLDALRLWNIIRPAQSTDDRGTVVSVDQHVLAEMKRKIRKDGVAQVIVDLMQNESLLCTFSNFRGLLHQDLAAKFPRLVTLSGHCSDDLTTAMLCFNENNIKSVAVTIHHRGRELYFADHDDEKSGDPKELYLRVPRVGASNWTDTIIEQEIPEGPTRSLLRAVARGQHSEGKGSFSGEGQRLNTVATARKFRLALITTAEFSDLRGENNVEGVMTWIANAMARVNGIFLKELGVMFELIADNDKLICLKGDSSCEHLKNDISIFDDAEDFMKDRGVTFKDYDIGHSFTTRMGGVALIRALCIDGHKHKGSSGYGTEMHPGDTFYLLLAHEFGHQLGAPHTFRDCLGPDDGDLHTLGAVEPGSGSTIMSYSGACGENNIQTYDDPWFNSHALVIMQDYLESDPVARCETAELMASPRPVMQTAGTCTVPKGNFVQLAGSIANPNDLDSEVFIAWDRVDSGYEDFTNTSVARFAPREPTTRSMARFLPNMYILSYAPDQLEEIAPRDGGGDQQMTFRFIGRTSYDPSATETQTFSADLAATFGYKDLTLIFKDDIQPLKFTNYPSTLKELDSVEIGWTGGSILDMIEIRVAVNTLTRVSSPDYDHAVEDLEFVSMGIFSNTGSAQVQVPRLTNPGGLLLNLMIASGTSECYFFDLVPGLQYAQVENGPRRPPTGFPSPAQSASPSAAPVTIEDSCTENQEHVCGYEMTTNNGVVPAYFSACLFDAKRQKYKSTCLARDDILALESTGWLNEKKRLDSCGCCASDAASHDFCGEPLLACPVEIYGGCTLKRGDTGVGVDVCFTDKRGKLKKKCMSPFKSFEGKEVLVGCGPSCNPP